MTNYHQAIALTRNAILDYNFGMVRHILRKAQDISPTDEVESLKLHDNTTLP
jgi:hypothetical protein